MKADVERLKNGTGTESAKFSLFLKRSRLATYRLSSLDRQKSRLAVAAFDDFQMWQKDALDRFRSPLLKEIAFTRTEPL